MQTLIYLLYFIWKVCDFLGYILSRQWIASFFPTHSNQTAMLPPKCTSPSKDCRCVKNKVGRYWFAISYDSNPGVRLTKAYDVRIQIYRNSHAKTENSKMHILRCMGSKLCVKFQRCPLKFHTKSEPIHRKICILRGVKNVLTYDILELWHLKS